LHTHPSTTKPGSKCSGIIRSGPEALPGFHAAAVAYSKVFSETKDQMRAPTLGDRVDRLAHFVVRDYRDAGWRGKPRFCVYFFDLFPLIWRLLPGISNQEFGFCA
jgi:hypothetical protein